MNANHGAIAQQMSEALLDHAKEIHRYARTFCEPSQANMALDEKHRRKFHNTVERMINEMHALLLMAKYKGVSRFCNCEQIEAYMEESRQCLANPAEFRQASPLFN